jgi:hypothetical protein
MAGAISPRKVKTAAQELAAMRRSLASWLHYRTLNDGVLAGTVQTKKPLAYAQRHIASARDMGTEQDLASKLHTLLSEIMPDAALPNADLRSNPSGAVQLAKIALAGKAPSSSPSAVGGVSASHPWLWPVLIVGGLLLVVTTAIKSAADVAAQKEQDACIEAGACTDYGFWLKAGGVAMIVYIAWKELGLGELVRGKLHGRRST